MLFEIRSFLSTQKHYTYLAICIIILLACLLIRGVPAEAKILETYQMGNFSAYTEERVDNRYIQVIEKKVVTDVLGKKSDIGNALYTKRLYTKKPQKTARDLMIESQIGVFEGTEQGIITLRVFACKGRGVFLKNLLKDMGVRKPFKGKWKSPIQKMYYGVPDNPLGDEEEAKKNDVIDDDYIFGKDAISPEDFYKKADREASGAVNKSLKKHIDKEIII